MGTGNDSNAFHGEGCLIFPRKQEDALFNGPCRKDVSIYLPFNPWIVSLELTGGMGV